MKVTICSNTETLRSEWEEAWDAVEHSDCTVHDDDVAQEYVSVLSREIEDKIDNVDVNWESNFQYWNGGWGSKNPGRAARCKYEGAPEGFNDDVLYDCMETARQAALAVAQKFAEDEIKFHAEESAQ